MNKLLIVLFACILLSGCDKKSDDVLLTEAKLSVKSTLENSYKQGECRRWQSMSSNEIAPKARMIAVCDSNFNISNGVVFSEMKVYRHKRGSAVCGIVSGETDISKIGAKFVYVDSNESPFIKMSKYPVLLSGGESSRKLTEQLIDVFNRSYESWCN
ncbi:hypothetical protein MCV52_001789 [Salmonella enterica]|uniref:Lipoprotein n=1 Tax=Salmonella enterica TaxID=28901 RepID=A0A630NFX7_SALER|nr:hypothetical protein [Salmonella enterica]EAB5620666.1 hypothetical protein [Salmonella enterica subsp. enterica serovar Mississippi]ECS7308541.1 hypothetical protein [Salmonella enterica subsp. enterica]ECU8000478.1 hypothetical protein [Salmonella enterica subsp. enterica serovar O rough]EDO6546608.1 hypothetical protein [Salmonella enterica subsp. enterica serovar 4,[5],12:i:-]EDT1540732.1 hypothetical protein [Salmonella enterica subsp. enterica serovar Javiana]EEE7871958.1 hypothetica